MILALGDSKSAPDSQVWGYSLANMLASTTENAWRAIELGRGGYTADKFENNLDENHDVFGWSIIEAALTRCETSTSNLDRCTQALRDQQPTYIFVNVGVNDVGFVPPWTLPDQTTWQNDYISALDQINAQWPDALIFVTKPWKRQTGGNEAVFDTMAWWIDNVVAARSTFAFAGDDERAWFMPNVATYSDDGGVHYNATGQLAAAAAKLAVLP